MAGKTVLELPVRSALANTDRLIVVYNASNNSIAQTATITVTNIKKIYGPIADPAGSGELIVEQGTMLFSNGFLYVATANNVVKKLTLSSF